VIPGVQHLRQHFFHVVEVLLRLDRVVDAVVTLLVKFFIGDCWVDAVVGTARRLDQSVCHQGAGGDDGIDDAAVDQFRDDQSLFGDGHGAGQSHDPEAVFVERHGFEDVGGFAQLAAGEGRPGHGPNQVIDGFDLAEIERFEGNQPVFHGIVQMAIRALAAGAAVLRIVVIALFHNMPPSGSNLPIHPRLNTLQEARKLLLRGPGPWVRRGRFSAITE